MENAHYSTKPVGECLPRIYIIVIFMRQSHKVGMRSWVQRILGTLEVIRCVVHTEGIVFVNVIIYDYESVALLCCEWVLIAIVLAPK